jgi:hypothetical protein
MLKSCFCFGSEQKTISYLYIYDNLYYNCDYCFYLDYSNGQ